MGVTVRHFADAHDGPGYYYAEDEDPGSLVGAFDSLAEAISDAKENGHDDVKIGHIEPKSTKARTTIVSNAPPPPAGKASPQTPDFLVPLMVPKKLYAEMVQHLALLSRDAPPAAPTEADGLVLKAIDAMSADPEKWFTFNELLMATGVEVGKLRNSISAYNRRVNREKTRAQYRTQMIAGKTYYKYTG